MTLSSSLQSFFDKAHAAMGDKTAAIVTIGIIFLVFTFLVFLAVVATCFRGLFKTDSEDAEIGRRITAQANAHLCYMSGVPCGRGCPCERRRKRLLLLEKWNTSDSSLCSPEKRSPPGSPDQYIPPALPFKPRVGAPETAHVRTRPTLPINQGNPYAQYMRNTTDIPTRGLHNQVPQSYAVPSYQQTVLAQPKAVRLPAMNNEMNNFLLSQNSGYQEGASF